MRNLARRGASSLHVQAFAYSFLPNDNVLPDLDSWIRHAFVYRGENQEVIRTPEYMLAQFEREGHLEGDCDDISTLYAAFLKALGFQSRFVAIRVGRATDFSHVYVEVSVPNGWIAVDPTVEHGTPYFGETERMVLDV
jgi:Transglutaminase-like superfamily